MTRPFQAVFFGLVLGLLVLGVALLYKERLGVGDVYPAYSTFRADPLGTRAFYEALAAQPSLHVERSLAPLESLPSKPGRTLILAGTGSRFWEELNPATRRALDASVRGGVRLVVIFAAETNDGKSSSTVRDRLARERKEKAAEEKQREGEEKSPSKDSASDPSGEKASPPDEKKSEADEAELKEKLTEAALSWEKLWGVEVASRWISDTNHGAIRRSDAPRAFPATLACHSDLYFQLSPEAPWQTLYTHGARSAMIERRYGQGSIVMASDAYFISNEALQRDRASALLIWLIGNNTQIVFSENQLDLAEEGGLAVLARHYGLGGAFFMLLVLAILYVWRQVSLFVPPAIQTEEMLLQFHPTAGLEALLRRSIRKTSLFALCRTEWKGTARSSDLARIDSIDAQQPPTAAYNAAVKALRRK